jgi:hypothetical protein
MSHKLFSDTKAQIYVPFNIYLRHICIVYSMNNSQGCGGKGLSTLYMCNDSKTGVTGHNACMLTPRTPP